MNLPKRPPRKGFPRCRRWRRKIHNDSQPASGEISPCGIDLAQRETGDTFRLEGDLPQDISADALQALERHKLSIPRGRKLVIETRQQAPAN